MPAKVRVEAPRPHRHTLSENLRWLFSVLFVGCLPASCVGLLATPADPNMEMGDFPVSPPFFFIALAVWVFYKAYKSGRLDGPPVPIQVPTQKEAPPEPEPDLSTAVYLGLSLTDDRKQPKKIYLDHATRNRHVYLIGKTRTGKTSVMKNMIEQDMRAGNGLCFIDPHGDAAEDLAGVVPDDRINDVIYFDPTKEHAPAFNPFALEYQVAKLAEDIVSVFAMLVGDSWGPRLEHILRFSVMTLIADKRTKHTLADLKTMLLDEAFRGEVLSGIKNRQLLEFWALEFPNMPATATAPILNKLSAFLAPMSDLERVFSRRRNDLDFTDIMDHGKILIVNLSKGILGDEPSRLLGGLIVAGVQQAALARAAQPEHTRRDFYLYVDEFQNYTVSSFADILSESAKYKLNLTLAHQNLGQVPDYLRRSIFGNVATLIAYQVSAQDAPVLAKEMHRSRIVVREKNSNEPLTLDEFMSKQTRIYAAAASDPMRGMSRADELRFASRYQIESTNPHRGAIKNQQASEELRGRGEHIARVLNIFAEDVIDVSALASLFPDFAFKDLGYPSVDDFVNLPPHHGYVRIGTAANVQPLAPPKPTDPNPKTQRLVFDRRWDRGGNPLETNSTTDAESSNDFIFGSYDDES